MVLLLLSLAVFLAGAGIALQAWWIAAIVLAACLVIGGAVGRGNRAGIHHVSRW
jgi:hypothetical protein